MKNSSDISQGSGPDETVRNFSLLINNQNVLYKALRALNNNRKIIREQILDEILDLVIYVEDNDGVDLTYLKNQIKSLY